MIKFASLLLSAFIAASASDTAMIETERRYTGITVSEYGNIVFMDELDLLDESEEKNVYITIVDAVKAKDISIGVVSAENTDETAADEIYGMISDSDADFVLMLFNENGYSYHLYGAADAEFSADEDAFWMTDEYMEDNLYFIGCVQFPLEVQYHVNSEVTYTQTTEAVETTPSELPDIYFDEVAPDGIHTALLENNHTALLHDIDDSLTVEEEKTVLADLMQAVRETNYSICIVITDDIGSDKSDYGVMDYADVYYENYCGMNTDGVLLLINNDTKYDWFSTSGRCIDMFYGRDDDIFDAIYDYIVSGDYTTACQRFVNKVKSTPYQNNSAYNDNNYDDYDNSYSGELHLNSSDIEGFFSIASFSVFVSLTVVIVFISVLNNNYKMRKNVDAANYKLENSLFFSHSTDTYLRTYTTRTTVSSSSSGRSRSHRSGGSRSHRSSGGGRHGGGGRRR